MQKKLGNLILLLLLCVLTSSVFGQGKTRILFVFDASNSMNARWEDEAKIKTATRLLSASMDELYEAGTGDVDLALRVYGHQFRHIPGKQNCDDTELVVPFSSQGVQTEKIKDALKKIKPQGTTPIARSLEKAAEDFPNCKDCRNVIILITDGIEACDEDPCAVSRALQAKGIILKPFIIGVGLGKEYIDTFQCVGNYYDASSEDVFESVLKVVVSQALNDTSVQIDLLDENGEPTITNVPMSIYDDKTGVAVRNLVHTLNKDGNPDTLTLDPVFGYRVKAHTLPPISISGQTLRAGEHNHIQMNAAQGDLELKFANGRGEYDELKVVVYKKGTCERVNVQAWDTSTRYLAGEYDVEIQTNPVQRLTGLEIKPNETTPIQIPIPGLLYIQCSSMGFGGVYEMKDNELSLVLPFDEGFVSGKYVLQPGSYTVIFRARNAPNAAYTVEKEIRVESGRNVNLSL